MEKGKIFMVVIIALLVFLLIAIGFLGFTFFNFMNKEESEQEATHTDQVEKLAPEEIEILPLSKPVNTNLLVGADNVSHIASVDFSVGVNNTEKESPEFIELLVEKETIIRSICGEALRNKTYEELKRPDGPDLLAAEILVKLQEEFETNLIYQVYIKDIYLE